MHERALTEREEEQDILFGVINRFIGYFTRQAVPHTSNDTTSEYPFVAMDTRQAYEQIKIARAHLHQVRGEKAPFSFIDVGCGIGNILLLAELMEFAVFGIEKDTGSLDIARNLVGETAVKDKDIWSYNSYNAFDIIYYFRPFCEKKVQVAFEQKIENSMQVGTILIANRKMDDSIDSDSRFKRLSPDYPIWCRTS